MDEILEAFLQESDELLDRMEDLLLSIENDPENTESLNGIFRSVHTIKGSAGMFGFDWMVEFTHVLENLLEKMRSGKIRVRKEIIEELLVSKDYISQLVHTQVHESQIPTALRQQGEAILTRVKPFLEGGHSPSQAKSLAESETNVRTIGLPSIPESQPSHKIASNYHLISLRPNPNAFANALDPYSFIKYLQELGTIQSLKTIVRGIPDWNSFQPETCYLGFEICLQSEATTEKIAQVFEFLAFDSLVEVLPPHTELSELKKHIQNLPEDEIFLSNLYRELGYLTQEELVGLLESFHPGRPSHPVPASVPGSDSSKAKSTGADPYAHPNSDPSNPSGTEDGSFGTNQESSEFVPDTNSGSMNTKPAGATVSSINRNTVSASLRVDSARVDHLINKVGELVVSEANLSQLLQTREDSAVNEALHSVSRLIHEIREISLKLRMIPIGESFNKYHRIVRDLGNDLSKKVNLHIQGAETELDKTVMEKLADPMVHIVRNAIDHGLETPEERTANGKPADGNLRLNAFHETGSIIIEISDDGKGIDSARVFQKAVEKGILTRDAKPSPDEIYRLLFHPGFSTAEKITNISGRGVGLDVVQKNIESLRGSIQVQSELGKGTKFTIRLPLTLAIIDGFLFASGPDLYVIPLDMVRECVDFREELKMKDHAGTYFNLRGSVLPYVRLDEFFHGETNHEDRENILVTEYQGQKFGLVVGRLFGEFQTVIKPLAKVFENIRGIGGSTTLGDGSIALILDVADLHQSLKEKHIFEKSKAFADNKGRESVL